MLHINLRDKMHVIIKYILPLLFIQFSLLSKVLADKSFLPWDSKVKVADENISIKTRQGERYVNIYNSQEGGLYFLIRFFQIVISPQDGPNCRFHPTCSSYGRTALERFGTIIGSMLIGDRLLRCNNSSTPGDDPVPKSISK